MLHIPILCVIISFADGSRVVRLRRTDDQCHLTEKRTTLHAELTKTSATVRCRTVDHRFARWRRRNGHLCWLSAQRPQMLGRRKVTRRRATVIWGADCTASRPFKRSSNSGSTTFRVAAYNIYRRCSHALRSTERRSTSDGRAVDLLISLERAVQFLRRPTLHI